MNLQNILKAMLKNGYITFLDFEIYKTLKREFSSELLGILALVLNMSIRKGDSCIDIEDVADKKLCEIVECDEDYEYDFPDAETIKKEISSTKDLNEILVLDDNMLFFERIYSYEKKIAEKIQELADNSKPLNIKNVECEVCDFWQKLAVAISAGGRLLIMSGGPGTGKTTTIKSIVKHSGHKKIGLCAPTGKAVSRMIESLDDLNENLEGPMTLHRLLGANSNLTRFYYNEENRLPFNIVILDEASMVSIEMIYRLLVSLKDDAKLILIGDKDQLSSVETGAFLTEVCSFKDRLKAKNLNIFSEDFVKKAGIEKKDVEILPNKIENPIIDSTIELIKNFRFKKDSGIGQLSNAIRKNDIEAAEKIVDSLEYEDLTFKESFGDVVEDIADKYEASINSDVVNSFKDVKVLTPLRVSELGSIKINEIIDRKLRYRFNSSNEWYNGRQIIINVNDYQNDLFNGDIGVYVENDAKKEVVFRKTKDKSVNIAYNLLPQYETAFALSVHKSQGSEFDTVYFVIGKKSENFLTRELIYTALTRAKSKICIVGSKEVFLNGLKKSQKRKSMLGKFLYSGISY